MDDELRQLLDLLEAAVPADSNRLGDAKGNRLVEIAQEIAQLPVPQAPLSEEDFLKIERAVRIEAERIGVPHFPPPVGCVCGNLSCCPCPSDQRDFPAVRKRGQIRQTNYT